jgi:hypothetical protein
MRSLPGTGWLCKDDYHKGIQGGNEMAEETRQGSTFELSDAERRRQLALVYRLLIEVGQRGDSACERREARQEPVGKQAEGKA